MNREAYFFAVTTGTVSICSVFANVSRSAFVIGTYTSEMPD
jgi:hypothetical protein